MRKHDDPSLVTEAFMMPCIFSKQRKESNLTIEKGQDIYTEENNMATSRASTALKRETTKKVGKSF